MLSLSYHTILVTLTFSCYSCTLELVERKCPDIPKLDVVPGLGWDALTNNYMSQTLKITYKECKVTTDGKYLIPDGTNAFIVKTKHQHLNAEIIDHWSNYTSVTARGFKYGIGLGWESLISLNFYYSDDYQKLKSIQVKHGAFTVRTQLQNLLYTVHAEPYAALSDDLRAQFIKVMKYISRNHTDNAEYLLQMIVSNYGTHYTKSVDAGAIFVKEDFLKTSFLHNHMNEKQKILTSAKLSVLNYIGFSTENARKLDDTLVAEYENALIVESTRAIGGPHFDSTLSTDQWLARTAENVVAIDRSGDLITSFISPSKFPNAPLWLLKKMHVMLTKTIQNYYTFNSRLGCTKAKSPNFDYNANVDDGSCEAVSHNHSFGGVYQTCHQPHDTGDACNSFRVKNILTGSFSCPEHFETHQLYSQTKSYSYSKNYPWQQCSGWWVWKRCWHNDKWVRHYDNLYITTFQCMADTNPKILQTNYQFGGVYSSMVTNINTRKLECPKLFRPINIFGYGLLTVCIRNNIDTTNPNTLSFGGLTSCEMGLQCPPDYHGHLALVYEGCQINFCIQKINNENEGKIPLLVRPPFINMSEEIFSQDEDEEYNDYGVSLQLKDSNSIERKKSIAVLKDAKFMEISENITVLKDSNSIESKENIIAGIVLPLFVVLVFAGGLAYWQRKKIITHVQKYRSFYLTQPSHTIEMSSVDNSKRCTKPLL
uniref:MACPF domain-containing protein n=1 Tax=Strigamia maritima TaxID=126957 RepID=T1JN82_STRMM